MAIDIIGITETHCTVAIPTMWEKMNTLSFTHHYKTAYKGVSLILNKQLSEHMIN